MDELTPEGGTTGVSRRDMLRRSALVGGALVWTAPAVQTLASPAFAAGSETPGGPPGNGNSGGISYVVVLAKCGADYFMIKYGDTGQDGCGGAVHVSNDDLTCSTGLTNLQKEAAGHLASACPTFGGGSDLGGGVCDLTVQLGACTLEGYIVHDGQLPSQCYWNTRNNGSAGNTAFNPAKFDPFPVIGSTGDICFNKK